MKDSAKRWIALSLAVLMLMVTSVGCGGGPSSGGNGTTTEPEPTITTKPIENVESKLPAVELSNKTVKVMVNSSNLSDQVTNTFKEQYGGTVEMMTVAYDEIPTKLASSVAGDTAPDLCLNRGPIDFFPYLTKNLIMPVDDYVDFKHSVFADVQPVLNAYKINGKQYTIPTALRTTTAVYFNQKMFDDIALEDPWTQYKNGKWDWDTFRATAKQLTQDVDDDGINDVFGVMQQRTHCLIYTSGKAYGSITESKKFINNLGSADMARVNHFIYDLFYTDKVGSPDVSTYGYMFKTEKVAMLVGDENVYYMPEVKAIAAKGNLGIAPLPKDPQADAYYGCGAFSSWVIPKNAENPQGAGALTAVMALINKDEIANENYYAELQAKYKLTDKNIEQLKETFSIQKPVIDLGAQLGADSTYYMVVNGVSWEKQLEIDAPTVQEFIDTNFNGEEKTK